MLKQLAFVLMVGAATVARAEPPESAAMAASNQPIGFKVRLRYMELGPAEPMSKLAKLIARTNRKEHDARFDDALNTGVVDAAKIAAYLDALRKLPADVQHKLNQATMLLDDPKLGLSIGAPTTPATIATLSGFSKLEVDGPYLVLVPTMRIDPVRARAQIAETRARIAELNAMIAKAGETPDGSQLKRDRFRLSAMWRTCAEAMVDHAADNKALAEASAELDRAKHEIANYVVNTGGMPDEDDTAPL